VTGREQRSGVHRRRARSTVRRCSTTPNRSATCAANSAPDRAGETHAQRFTEMLELATLADSLGFDVAWLAEIHFGAAFSLLSTPLMAVPAIAQRTKRIRVGTAVTLLPLHHPLACAEQAATAAGHQQQVEGALEGVQIQLELAHDHGRHPSALPG